MRTVMDTFGLKFKRMEFDKLGTLLFEHRDRCSQNVECGDGMDELISWLSNVPSEQLEKKPMPRDNYYLFLSVL